MKVLVVGAGGVGGYFGAKLARAGAQVCVVARGEHGSEVREHGLTLPIHRTLHALVRGLHPKTNE